MFEISFWFLLLILAIVLAVVIARKVMAPIKARRSDKEWEAWKKETYARR